MRCSGSLTTRHEISVPMQPVFGDYGCHAVQGFLGIQPVLEDDGSYLTGRP